MKKPVLAAISILLGISLASPVFAQANRRGEGLRMPYQGNFWGYAGLNLGRSSYDLDCGGFSCNQHGDTFKAYAGGKFNDWLGLEAGWIDMGRADFAGGHADAQGLNVSLTAGVPIGGNSSVFGKIGTTYGHTRLWGTSAGAPSGSDNGWGLSYGIGGQFGLSRNWAVRLDADRYRFKFTGGNDRDVDTITVGLQYEFR